MNEGVLVEGRSIAPSDALAREEAAFAGLRSRIADLDPRLLSHRLGNGDTLEGVIRYDGSAHYAEHTGHLRAWFGSDTEDQDTE
jgi:hypothetical protein